jgi:hypothetical protein
MGPTEINRNQLEAERRTSESAEFLRDSHNEGCQFAPSSSKFENPEEFRP